MILVVFIFSEIENLFFLLEARRTIPASAYPPRRMASLKPTDKPTGMQDVMTLFRSESVISTLAVFF